MWGLKKQEKQAQDGPKSQAAAPQLVERDASSPPVDDPALDTVGAVLRTLGKHAFDLEGLDAGTIERQFEAWASHVLLGAPRPGADRQEAMSHGGRRDWAGVRQHALEQRILEQQFVIRSQDNFREITWAFLDSLRTALLQDQDSDERVKVQLNTLSREVATGSIGEIRRAVLHAVAGLTELVEERRRSEWARLDELGSKVSELGGQLQQAKEESALDGLTRLYNRPALDAELTKVTYLRDVFGQPASMLMVDVDHFKWVNDRFGHPAGDGVLKSLADCLVRSFPRKADFVSRLGGEEFVIVLVETTLADAVRLGDRFLQAARDLELECNGEPLRITVSAGVAEIGATESAEAWLARTDGAMYQAKDNGRDRLAQAEAA